MKALGIFVIEWKSMAIIEVSTIQAMRTLDLDVRKVCIAEWTQNTLLCLLNSIENTYVVIVYCNLWRSREVLWWKFSRTGFKDCTNKHILSCFEAIPVRRPQHSNERTICIIYLINMLSALFYRYKSWAGLGSRFYCR